MIKNAIAYITRKRNRTLIIFIILTIVLSCLYSCLTIMKSSNEIEKIVLTNLRIFFHSKLQIILKEIFFLSLECLQLMKEKI